MNRNEQLLVTTAQIVKAAENAAKNWRVENIPLEIAESTYQEIINKALPEKPTKEQIWNKVTSILVTKYAIRYFANIEVETIVENCYNDLNTYVFTE